MRFTAPVVLLLFITGCNNDPAAATEQPTVILGGDAGVDAAELPGTPVVVNVPATGKAFLDLDAPAVIQVPNAGADSYEWDLAFSGWDVFTNSGPSGPGEGKAFGPLEILGYFSDTPPDVPFLTEDRTGGAFLDWYDYDSSFHALYSRFHVYGVKRDGLFYAVQILGYYGEVSGAPVSAIYSIRYREIGASGTGPAQLVENIDGTAGGPSGSETSPSACLDLATGQISMLEPSAARTSPDWDLCFRRTIVSVNGELGGPGDVAAIDLLADLTAGETLAQNQQKTAASELFAFEAVDFTTLSNPDLTYRGDRIVSAFSDVWVDPSTTPPTFGNGCFRVVGANGRNHLIVFTGIEGYDASSAGSVTLRVRSFD